MTLTTGEEGRAHEVPRGESAGKEVDLIEPD
jgi:hypothetical protein